MKRILTPSIVLIIRTLLSCFMVLPAPNQQTEFRASRDLRDFAEQYGLNYQYKEVDGDHGQMVPMILPDVFTFFDNNR